MVVQLSPQTARAYWRIVLSSGKELSERDTKIDLTQGRTRPIDWTLDILATGDIRHIKELRLDCPDERSAWLRIDEAWQPFQFKVGMFAMGIGQTLEAQAIGKVLDRDSGACVCHIWDRQLGLIVGWESNVREIGAWKPGMMAIGALAMDVVGVAV